MSSFGPSQAEKNAQNSLNANAQQASKNSTALFGMGGNNLNAGSGNVQAGTNFFNTLLNGNQANTTAMLQPDIDRIRGANQNTIQSLSTLMPRGGGRSGTLFNESYAPTAQIQSLFNSARSGAAGNLANIGLGQEGIGTNLFGAGNQALNTSTGANQNLFGDAFGQRQYQNQLYGQLGQGLFGLATLPFGGGTAANGLLGLIP